MSTASSTVFHVNIQNDSTQILLHENCDPIHAVACHPKQPVVAMGNHGGILKVWNYKTKVILCRKVFEKNEKIQCIAFDPHGEPVYFLSKCFSFMTFHYILQHKPLCFGLCTGLYLAVGFVSGAVHILNPSTLQSDPEECFHHSKESIDHITFSSDSKYLATAVSHIFIYLICVTGNSDYAEEILICCVPIIKVKYFFFLFVHC